MNEQLHKIIVFILFRNVRNYIVDCVNSVLNQAYSNYEIYLLDDHSDDGTLNEIGDEIKHIHKIQNKRRLGAMESLFRGLVRFPFNNEDIIVVVDGDDFLLGEYVFQMLNAKYNEENILITYGQCITNYGYVKKFIPYTREDFNNIRNAYWNTPHLRTFKYKLFKQLLELDPNVNCFKHEDGTFLKSTADMGLMFPLLEIAGYENAFCFPNVLYCYRLHANNDDSTEEGRNLQLNTEYYIRSKQPLTQISSVSK